MIKNKQNKEIRKFKFKNLNVKYFLFIGSDSKLDLIITNDN